MLFVDVIRHKRDGGALSTEQIAFFVRGLEAFRDLTGNLQRIFDGNRPLCNSIGQSVTFHQFEDDVLLALDFFEFVNDGEIGMIQRRQNLCFAFETSEPVCIAGKHAG